METFISERVIMTSLTPDDQVQTVTCCLRRDIISCVTSVVFVFPSSLVLSASSSSAEYETTRYCAFFSNTQTVIKMQGFLFVFFIALASNMS